MLRNYKKHCRSKDVDKINGCDNSSSTKGNSFSTSGDVCMASTSTHLDYDAWFIHSNAYFLSLTRSHFVYIKSIMEAISS